MTISLNSFIQNLSNVTKPNRFLVVVDPPSDAIETSISSDIMQFYAQSAVIPDRTFGEIELKYYGMTLKLPGNESISDLTITFINDEEWRVRDFFEAWGNAIHDREDSSKGYMQNLFNGASIIVHQLDGYGNIIATYQFYNVFPKVVSEMELNMETNDSFSTFQVTFDYSHFGNMEIE
jgi:hypothetical protein